MTKKKDQKVSITQVDITQLQALLGKTHQIAQALHGSTNQHEAEISGRQGQGLLRCESR